MIKLKDLQYFTQNLWAKIKDVFITKENPVGTGSFSMNRKANSSIGAFSTTEGINNVATGIGCHAEGGGEYNSINLTGNGNAIVYTVSSWNDKLEINAPIYYLNSLETQTLQAKIVGLDKDNLTITLNKTLSSTNISNRVYYFLAGNTTASGHCCHAEGGQTTATGYYSHAEGQNTIASGAFGSHAEGQSAKATGQSSHAEGGGCVASGAWSHAEGDRSLASGSYSHAEGQSTASGDGSHSEGGNWTEASGYYSHAEGQGTKAKGKHSHSEGYYTIASSDNQHVQGKYNVEDTENKYAHIVGGGNNVSNRKNIHTLDWDGNAIFSGNVTATDSEGKTISLLELYTMIQQLQS